MSNNKVVPIRKNVNVPDGIVICRAYSTEDLKLMWDESHGDNPEVEELIHTVLNERGEGDYCAI